MKTIQVEDVYRLHGTSSACVPEDSSLREVITRLALETGPRGIFLVDSTQRFAGAITHHDLLRWVQLRFYGRTARTEGIFRLVFATKAKDLARGDRRSLGVKPTDTLETAIHQMVEHEEDIIPILDSKGAILGDLSLSEVLLKAVEVEEQSERQSS